jgi:hypothetical protein
MRPLRSAFMNGGIPARRDVTPGGCQIGYMDHTGGHLTILAVIDWCAGPYALLGLSLQGVRLVTWTILAVTWTILAVIHWYF